VKKPLHPKFRFNGHQLSQEELVEVAYSLIKEGEDFEIAIGDFLLDWFSPHPEIEVKTSGSTGNPKPIKLKKEQMVNSAMATGEFFELNENDKALLCLPANYIAGKMMLVRAMVLGLQIDYVNPGANPLLTVDKDYDFSAMVPLQVQGSLNDLSKIKTLIIGGAPVSTDLKNKLQDVSTVVFETYGMTETITHIAAKKISNISSSEVGTGFEILPNVTINVDDRGCLVIDAPNVSDKEVVTNDLVELISKSEFKWLGRYDNIINSGGVKLIPELIEQKLSKFISNRFFVTAVPDDQLGQKLVLVVEVKTKKDELLEELKSSKSLDRFEIPKEVLVVEKFMETGSGKIDRDKTLSMTG